MTISSRLLLLTLAVFLENSTLRAEDKVTVHEWGTFTCLQDETGKAITGINIDDEPVPAFVYDYGGVDVTPQYSKAHGNFGLPPYFHRRSKGWIPGDPEVTMRLETPVLYFYPPKGMAASVVAPLDVHVDFHGGILSQYYPFAKLTGLPEPFPGLIHEKGIFNHLVSSLTWKEVQLGSTEEPLATDDKVWTTPREVEAAMVEITAPVYRQVNGEMKIQEEIQAEKFLFYRGVGHLDSPLRLLFGFQGKVGTPVRLFVTTQASADDTMYSDGWLVEIKQDGSCAFRTASKFGGKPLGPMTGIHPATQFELTGDHSFAAKDFSPDNLRQLKTAMQTALVHEGLYPDEASAMLRTWELSYFKSPGLRFFYTVPHKWVDQVLPLHITGAPVEVTRVMVGRIELISEAQKAALARLSAGPCPNLAIVKKAAEEALDKGKLSEAERDAFYRGERPLAELGIAIPPLVADYLSLGRFRDALILHQQELRPSPALAKFIKENSLSPLESR